MKASAIFKQVAARIKRPSVGVQNTQLMHPTREWFIGLVSATTILVLIAAWSTQTYLRYEQLSVTETEPADAPQTVYRDALVSAAIETYTARQARYNELLTGAAAPVVTDSIATTTTEAIEPPPTPSTSTPATTTPARENPTSPAGSPDSDSSTDDAPTTPIEPESAAATGSPAAGLPGTF
ncbi:MAG: hypothetical protein ACOC4E_03165 [Patescibacteria group bacterium]